MKYLRLLINVVLAFLPALLPAAAHVPQDGSDPKADQSAHFGTLPNGLHYAVQHNAEPKPAAAAHFPQDGSDLKADQSAHFGTLPNGLRYVVLHNAEPKGRASLRFGVITGSFNETEDQRGLAHFLEHLAFNGSTHFPPGTLVEFFQRLGMSFGGDTNAFTSFDRTEYQLELPDTQPGTLDKAFTLFSDYGGGLLLKPESIEKERGIILSEERARDSVGLRAWQDQIEFLLPDAIIGQRLPIGLKDIVSHAQRERFADYYDTWYRPENFVVVAVGDFDPATVEAQLIKILSPLQPHGPARPKATLGTVKPTTGMVARLHTDTDAPAVTVAIEAVVPYAYEPDTSAFRLKRLPRGLALAMLNRRISILAKKEGSPFAAGETGIEEQFNFFRSSSFELTCQPGQWRETLGVAEQELRRALLHGFQPEELREVVAEVRNNLEQAVKEAATRPSNGLADGVVDSVIDRAVFTTPADDLALFSPALAKVTVEDCAAAFREVWNETAGRSIYISGNLTLSEPEKEITAAYQASQAAAVAAPEKTTQAKFGYTQFGPEGKVAVRQEVRDLGVILLEFENGVRLNLKHTDFEANQINLNVRIGGGRLTEPKNEPGLARAASGIFAAGGLGQHSMDELQRILAGKTVNFSFAVGDDAFALGGATNQQDFALQMELLCAFVTDPGYRPEAFRQFQKGLERTYAGLAHAVEGPFSTEVSLLMAGGDPRFGLPPKEVMQVRNSSEVKSWLTPQLATGPVEIAVVGDFDPEAIIKATARTFGALQARAPKPDYADERRVSIPARPVTREFTVPTEIDRAVVQLMWPATDGRDAHLARRINLLTEVFQDRLRLKLREQMGGTYSPNAGSSLSNTFPGYGFIVAQAAAAPARAEELAAAIRSVADEIVKNGITEDELQRAKQPLLTTLKTSERQNGYWLGSVLSAAQEQPQRLDWARDRYADIASITKADLDALAQQYLPTDRASQFISRPVEKAK